MAGFRLFRLLRALLIALACVILVTAVADISLAPGTDRVDRAPGVGASRGQAAPPDPRSDVSGEQTAVSVLEHEGGLADIRSWVTDRVDGALTGLESARLRTREILPL